MNHFYIPGGSRTPPEISKAVPCPVSSERKPAMKIQDSRIFITGGAVRVGAAIARAFAQNGAKLIIHCNRSVREAEQLIAGFGGSGAGHSVVRCDLSEPGSAAELAPALRSANILINNASVFVRRTLLEESGTEADRQFRINYTAPVELMKLFAETGSGPRLIINMLDQGILHPDATSFSYAVSKKALAAATEAAALQLAPGIRVNGIAPGPVLPPVELPLSKMEKTLKTVPLGRPVALEDLCSACLFLAQNDSITGEILYVDGGQSLH